MAWPRALVWELTARCTLACGHCYNTWTAPGAATPVELSSAGRLAVLDRLAVLGRRLRALTLSGGEPLLCPDLEEFVGAARRILPRSQLSLATNGLLLDEARARSLRVAGLDTVQLTLLAARPELHDSLAGSPGAFAATLAALAGARAAGLKVAVFFVATARNIDEGWPGAAKLALALGADGVVFNRFQPGGRALASWRELTPSPAQLARALEHVEELRPFAGSVQLGTPIPPCERPEGIAGTARRQIMACPAGTARAYPAIGPDGGLRPCNHCPSAAGSLLERELLELLATPSMRTPPGELPPECAGCPAAASCRGGCVAARRLVGAPIYGV